MWLFAAAGTAKTKSADVFCRTGYSLQHQNTHFGINCLMTKFCHCKDRQSVETSPDRSLTKTMRHWVRGTRRGSCQSRPWTCPRPLYTLQSRPPLNDHSRVKYHHTNYSKAERWWWLCCDCVFNITTPTGCDCVLNITTPTTARQRGGGDCVVTVC